MTTYPNIGPVPGSVPTENLFEQLLGDSTSSPPKAKNNSGLAGKYLQQLLPNGLRGAVGFGVSLLNGQDPFRAGMDSLTAISPTAGLAVKSIILPDNMTAAGTLEEARARGLY